MELAENVVVANRFRLVRLVGKGGMGSVWRAFDQNLGTDCAIKFIEGDLAKRPEAQTRFKREAQAAAQLRSPNIVQIFDHNVWEGVPYCAMEFLEGEDLGKRLLRMKKIPHVDVAHVMSEACRGLQKAHERGIIHRDLKPDNIFIVKDDDRELVKVLDFGIAKLTDGGMDVSSGTKTGAIMGTPQYMSPEQAQGTKAIDARSDLWSLAIIAYECITGQLPLDSKALGDLLVKIIVNPMPIPSQIDPSVPPGFDAWFAKATSRDPEGRFQSARAFADSLSVSLGVAAPIGARMASMAGESGAYNLGITGAASPASGPNGGPSSGVSGVSSEAVLRPLSVTFAGGELAAGVPRKGSTGRILAIGAGVALLLAAVVIAVVALRPKGTTTASAATGVQAAAGDSAKPDLVSTPVITAGSQTAQSPAGPATVTSANLDTAGMGGVGGSPVASGPPGGAGGSTVARPGGGTGKNGSGKGGGGGKPGTKPGGKPDLGF